MCVCGGGEDIYFIETRNPNSINDGNKGKFGQWEIEYRIPQSTILSLGRTVAQL